MAKHIFHDALASNEQASNRLKLLCREKTIFYTQLSHIIQYYNAVPFS